MTDVCEACKQPRGYTRFKVSAKKPMTQEEHDRIVELGRQGYSVDEIINKFNEEFNSKREKQTIIEHLRPTLAKDKSRTSSSLDDVIKSAEMPPKTIDALIEGGDLLDKRLSQLLADDDSVKSADAKSLSTIADLEASSRLAVESESAARIAEGNKVRSRRWYLAHKKKTDIDEIAEDVSVGGL